MCCFPKMARLMYKINLAENWTGNKKIYLKKKELRGNCLYFIKVSIMKDFFPQFFSNNQWAIYFCFV